MHKDKISRALDAVNKNNGFSVVARADNIKTVLIHGDIKNFDIIEKIP